MQRSAPFVPPRKKWDYCNNNQFWLLENCSFLFANMQSHNTCYCFCKMALFVKSFDSWKSAKIYRRVCSISNPILQFIVDLAANNGCKSISKRNGNDYDLFHRYSTIPKMNGNRLACKTNRHIQKTLLEQMLLSSANAAERP